MRSLKMECQRTQDNLHLSTYQSSVNTNKPTSDSMPPQIPNEDECGVNAIKWSSINPVVLRFIKMKKETFHEKQN